MPLTREAQDYITNEEDWEEIFSQYKDLRKRQDGVTWEMADLAKKAAERYSGLKRLAEGVGERYNTLTQYAYVARQYEPVTRHEELTFSHHRVVAHMDDRHAWLAKAIEFEWSVSQLLQAVADSQPAVEVSFREVDELTEEEDAPHTFGGLQEYVQSGNINNDGTETVAVPPWEPSTIPDPLDMIINTLNDTLALDPELIKGFMQVRVAFSPQFAQVFPVVAGNENLGVLGFLNIALAQFGYIMPVLHSDGGVMGFRKYEELP